MPNNADALTTYSQVKQRLDDIVKEVKSDDISLDDALALYEEAVKLGLRASDLIEDETLSATEQQESDDQGAAPSLA